MDSCAGQTMEVEYERGGASHQVVLSFEHERSSWRGATTWRDTLDCATLGDTLVSAFTIEVPEQTRRMTGTCVSSLDTFTAEATMSRKRGGGLTEFLIALHATTLRELAIKVADEVEACDSRFRRLMDATTRAIADASLLVPHGLTLGAAAPIAPASFRGLMHRGEHARTTGYLTRGNLTGGYLQAARPRASGIYGAVALSNGGYLGTGYIKNGVPFPASQRTDTHRAARANAPERSPFDTALETLSLRLFRLQSLQAALSRMVCTDA